MKYISIISLVIILFSTTLCGQIKFYDLLDGIPQTEVQVDSKTKYQIDGDNFNNAKTNVLNDSIFYFMLSKNDSITIFSPVDYNIINNFKNSNKLVQPFASTKLRLIDNKNQKVYDVEFSNGILTLKKDQNTLFAYYNKPLLGSIYKIKELNFSNYSPLMELILIQYADGPYPNCKSCTGDVNSVKLYSYQNEQIFYKSVVFRSINEKKYNLSIINYECFLMLYSKFQKIFSDLSR